MAVFEFGLYRPDSTKPRAIKTSILVPLGLGLPPSDSDNNNVRVDVTYLEQTNDDGTTTRTVECGLESWSSITTQIGNNDDLTVPNPVQTLFWNSQDQKYDLYYFYDDNNDNNDNNLADPTILARECWCTRVFGTFNNSPWESANPTGPIFCPVQDDTDDNGSSTSGSGEMCTASAVFSEDDSTILAQESICFKQDQLMEFSKSIWPLSFFWYFILLCILVGTHYGRRVRGHFWRVASIQSSKLFSERTRKRQQQQQQQQQNQEETNIMEQHGGGDIEAPRSSNNNNNENSHGGGGGDDDDDDAPDNPESTTAAAAPPIITANQNNHIENDSQEQPQSTTNDARSSAASEETSGDDDDDDTVAIIVEEFGSVQNYRLLDRELRFQADRTSNEFVTWLWYSAVYTDVRRYRYEQYRRRRRERSRGGNGEAAAASDNDDDDDVVENEVDLMRNPRRRLDSVFWFPPASPDGERWEHLRNQGIRTHDENGNRVDGNRLLLKTKRFVMPETTTTTTTTTKDSSLVLAAASGGKSEKKDENDDDDPSSISVVDENDASALECGQSSIGDAVCIDIRKIDDTPMRVDASKVDAVKVNNIKVVDAVKVDVVVKDTTEVDDAEIGENVCSICLGEIEEGDLVGDIPCGHVFHKDCLKAWLVKNNHCPVCRMPGIASHPLLGTPAPTV